MNSLLANKDSKKCYPFSIDKDIVIMYNIVEQLINYKTVAGGSYDKNYKI